MKTYLDCIPCFFKQALFAARKAVDDEEKIKAVLDRVGMLVSKIPLESSPPETGREVYRAVREITGVDDPFKSLKEENIDKALGLYPSLEEIVRKAKDPLETAVRLAIAGNVIDFGANPDFELEKDVQAVLHQDPAINHYQAFKDKLATARNILYVGDNAGETVFDKLLIETMGRPVTFAARERPIINDATEEDATRSGLGEVATVISSGSDAPGTVLEGCSDHFRDLFREADLIISKGQGNYETLSTEKGPLFYLLKAKCPVIAKDIGVEVGDTVIKYGSSPV
ncbi:MAG: ARMT1-like domain-containing protein [Thermodesulfobacteriota bacterium]|nr:ARMT1-like domain-containing protein [Thermodesulfobacteriota bacterium]